MRPSVADAVVRHRTWANHDVVRYRGQRLGIVREATWSPAPSGERSPHLWCYQVFIEGEPVANLSGYICECAGPGDNTTLGKKEHLRIREGRYPLSTQFGPDYRSVGYTDDETHPMPGFLLLETETARISWCIQAIDQVCICPASDASI